MKMININIRIGIWALTASILMTSCHDRLLNPVPESVLTNTNAYNSAKDIELAVLGIYNSLQSKVQKDYLLMEMPSDNMYAEYYASEPGLLEVEFLRVSSENNILNNFWKTAYNGIFRANTLLANIDRPTDFASGDKEQMDGEARFLRALFYFDLARIFGDVPLVVSQLSVEEAQQVGRNSKSEIMDLIVSDLKAAISNLRNPDQVSHGRASKAAAQALLGKVYMHQRDWSNAIDMLESVINDYNYELVDHFGDLFDLQTEVNSEAVFSVAFVEGTNGHALSTTFAPLQGVYGIVPNGTRVGRPSWSLHKLYSDEDTRKPVALTEWQLPANANPDDDPIWYPFVNKYMVPHQPNNSGLDIPKLRLGDIILLYSEALIRSGNTAEALIQLNKVRERAFGNAGHNYSSADFTDEESFIDLLLLERRLELAFENERWFDLIRTDRFTSVLTEFEGEYNPGTGTAEIQTLDAQPYMEVFPIPNEQIQLAESGVLTQNEGY